jgi:hypothetical protein
MQVNHRGAHDGHLGRKVMQHCAARQARLVCDRGSRCACIADFDETANRRFDDEASGRGTFLRLPAGRCLCFAPGPARIAFSRGSRRSPRSLKNSKLIETDATDC